MGSPMTASQFKNLLEPGLRDVFHMELDNQAALHKRTRLFTVTGSERAFEEHMGIGALGGRPGDWDHRKTGTVRYEGLSENYKTQFVHRLFSHGILIEKELLDDNLYAGQSSIPSAITERPEKLAMAVEQVRENIAAEVLNNAFTDSGVAPSGFGIAGVDSVGLCSTAHPYGPNDSTTQSNEGTNALSIDNVDAARQAMRAFTDDKGNLVSVNPDILVVPPELEADALRIARSNLEPGHANNDANVVGGRIKEVIVWDYLTDANAWFYMDDALRAKCLIWYDRLAPEFESMEEFDSLGAKYRAVFRCSRRHKDWRFVYGNNPS